MAERLKDKVAIVTGGSVGIGQATSVLFAEEGAKVVVANPNEAAGESCAAEIRAQGGDAIFVRTDISKEDDCRNVCDRAVEKFGQLNILVNNGAAFILRGLEATVEEWNKILGVNVIGTALMSRFASEHMKTSRRRRDRQCRIDFQLYCPAIVHHLQHHQSRARADDAEHGSGFGAVQYPRELRLSRHDSDARVLRAHGKSWADAGRVHC